MSESFSAVNILVIPTAKRDFVDTQNNTHLVVPCGLDLNYIEMFWISYKKESAILTQIKSYFVVILKGGIPGRVPVFLGELTPELKPRQHIDEFAFVGCKNYTCKVANRGTCSQYHKG